MSAAFNLTPRQHDALGFIAGYIARNGGAPTYVEIGAGIGLRSKGGVAALVYGLVARGRLRKLNNSNRSLTLCDDLSAPRELPAHLIARLGSYCRRHGERFDAVLADAVTFHLDEMEREHERDADVVSAGGG